MKPPAVRQKVILVTGASSGIGKAAAKDLVERGHTVYAAARKTEQMRDLELMGAIPMRVDVTCPVACEVAVNRIIAQRGHIDVLFNNAGFGAYGAIEEVDLDTARYQFEVNVFGVARMIQLVLPHMRLSGAGTIINTSSIAGKMYEPLGGLVPCLQARDRGPVRHASGGSGTFRYPCRDN